jgi:hypothetical protein
VQQNLGLKLLKRVVSGFGRFSDDWRFVLVFWDRFDQGLIPGLELGTRARGEDNVLGSSVGRPILVMILFNPSIGYVQRCTRWRGIPVEQPVEDSRVDGLRGQDPTELLEACVVHGVSECQVAAIIVTWMAVRWASL